MITLYAYSSIKTVTPNPIELPDVYTPVIPSTTTVVTETTPAFHLVPSYSFLDLTNGSCNMVSMAMRTVGDDVDTIDSCVFITPLTPALLADANLDKYNLSTQANPNLPTKPRFLKLQNGIFNYLGASCATPAAYLFNHISAIVDGSYGVITTVLESNVVMVPISCTRSLCVPP